MGTVFSLIHSARSVAFSFSSHIVLFANGICTQQHQQSSKKSFFTHIRQTHAYFCNNTFRYIHLVRKHRIARKEDRQTLADTKQNHFIKICYPKSHAQEEREKTHHTHLTKLT